MHDNCLSVINGTQHEVLENILHETTILAHLTEDKLCPDSIVMLYGCFQSNINYYLVMEDGGQSLFDLVQRAYKFMQCNKLDVDEWLKVCKLLFKQMVECIEYIHSKNIAHFDISLENWLINDIAIKLVEDEGGNEKIRFCVEGNAIQCKLCDFGM